MSLIMYDGKRLIPAGRVSISKQYQKTNDSTTVGKGYSIVVTGTIIAFKGSPDSNGTFYTSSGFPADETIVNNSRLSAIQRKQEAIRDLFSNEGLQFEVQALDGSQSMKCNPRILGVDFAEGLWYNRSEYTITMEADELFPKEEDVFAEYISGANENWTIDTDEGNPEGLLLPRTYRMSHSVSAQGKRFYDDTGTLVKPAWKQARDFVLARLGFDNTIMLSSGVNNLPSYYGGVNHVRNENIDELGGNYSVTETWVLASGTALEDFTVSTRSDLTTDIANVTIEGSITGLEQRDANLSLTTSKYDNAATKFTVASGLAFGRAQTYAGKTLNIVALSDTTRKNPITGTISYSFEYDTRPSNYIPSAKSEVITVTENLQGDIFAEIPVLGRTAGPVLQDINTKTAKSRQLSIELVMSGVAFVSTSQSDIQAAFFDRNPRLHASTASQINNVIDAINPSNNGFGTVFQSNPQENWNPKDGRYTYSTIWTYE